MDPDAVLVQLDPALAGAELVEVGEGWDNVAWSVETGDEPLILRIGKLVDQAEQAAVTTTDAALLEFVSGHSCLATNRVVAVDPNAGALLLTRVAGMPADLVVVTDPVRLGGALGAFLRRLHAAQPPAGLVESGSQAPRWRDGTAAAFVAVADRVEPAGRSLIDAFLTEPLPVEPGRLCFCHNDLGDEHILLDPATGMPLGVIDWSDARLTDPAVDFASIWFDLGADVVAAALGAYGPVDDDVVGRCRWYALHAGIAGVAARAATGDPGLAQVLSRVREVSAEQPARTRAVASRVVDGGDNAGHTRA